MTSVLIYRSKNPGDGKLRTTGLECTYNLFRRSGCDSLVCAAPIDRPVPDFLAGREWLFVRALHPSDRLPPGFSVKAVSEAARFNGFYLFYLTAELRLDHNRSGPGSDAEIRAHVRAILEQLRST
jgi:hypothetical protein